MNINKFENPELIELYYKILKELGVRTKDQKLCSNIYKDSYFAKFDNKQMVMADFNLTKNSSSYIIFNPIDDENYLCSNLFLEDELQDYLSWLVSKIFEITITKKLKFKYDTAYSFQIDDDIIKKLPPIDKYIYYKWKNIYNIFTATSSCKNIISVNFDYSDNSSVNIKFEYPFYRYLLEIQERTIFGIKLNNQEIKMFKTIYKLLIIDVFEEKFLEAIIIPKDSDKSVKFYAFVKFILLLKKLEAEKYNRSYREIKYDNLNKQISNLNFYFYNETYNDFFNSVKKLKEIDKEAYKNELEIRKESNPNGLLLKDNIMQENLPVIQNNELTNFEVFKEFSSPEIFVEKLNEMFEILSDENAIKKYKKSLNEIISLEKKAHNINIADSNRKYQKQLRREDKLYDIYFWQDVVFGIINKDGICLWENNENNKYYFRAGINGKIKSGIKRKISKKISSAINDELNNFIISRNINLNKTFSVEVRIVDNIEEATEITEKLNLKNMLVICIFADKIPIVEDEVFNIYNENEFFKCYGNLYLTKNLFFYNTHLIKKCPSYVVKSYSQRFNSSIKFKLNNKSYLFEKVNISLNRTSESVIEFKEPTFVNKDNKKNFIEEFIFYLVNENKEKLHYIMNWMAYFFQTFKKTNTALVLTGDAELNEELFFNQIIKPIFGSRYCSTICDDEYKKTSLSDIAKEKIFFHIGNIENNKTKFDNKTLSKIFKELLRGQIIESKNKDNKHEVVHIYGQILITSNSAYEIVKSYYSKCTVINTNNLVTILEKLELSDMGMLEDKININLKGFTDILSIYPIHKDFATHSLDTKDRDFSKKKEVKLVNEKVLYSQIDNFINAFKSDKDEFLKYFEPIKKDKDLFEPLFAAYEKGYFLNQYLFDYFSIVYDNSHNFKNKKQFIDKLKEKDAMFQQESDVVKAVNEVNEEKILLEGISSFKEVNYKKLSRINNYKLAKDIIVPNGFIITNRGEGNARFKYEYEDLELAEKMYETYDKRQLEKKQKT